MYRLEQLNQYYSHVCGLHGEYIRYVYSNKIRFIDDPLA
jgi:hypothetical protein